MSIYPNLEEIKASELIKANQEGSFYPVELWNETQCQGQEEFGPSASQTIGMTEHLHYPNEGTVKTHPSLGAANETNLGNSGPIPEPYSIIITHLTPGVRLIRIVKTTEQLGFIMRAMSTGVFVCSVENGSIASLAGLSFGEQILKINGLDLVRNRVDKIMEKLKNERIGSVIQLTVRDRKHNHLWDIWKLKLCSTQTPRWR